jgi:hypothetical protein
MSDAAAPAAGRGPTGRRPRLPRPGIAPLAGLLTTASALVQLLVRPVLGLADNGDYKRILNRLHLVAALPPGQPPKHYVVLEYVPGRTNNQTYQSTELIFIRFVHRLVVLFGYGPGMDLRAVGVAHAAVLGIAVWLIVRALPGPLGLRAATSVLLVVVLTDTRFVVYLDSFFTEPASMLALLFLVAGVLHAWRRPVVPPLALLGMTAAAVALVASKSQDAPLAVPIAVLLLARRSGWGRLADRWSGRVLPLIGVALVLATAGAYLRSQPADLDRDNRYNAVFVEILGHSHDPAGDLRALGLDPELARYAGRPIYLPHNALKDPHFGRFYEIVTHERIAIFYAEHPGRGLALGHRGATASMDLIPRGISPALGTETKASSVVPQYGTCKLCLYSTISRGWRGGSGVLVPALWLAAVAAAWGLSRRQRRGRHRGGRRQPVGVPADGLVACLLLLVAVAVVSMVVALLAEGEFEIVKHLYLASVGDALLAVLLIHSVGLLLWSRRRDSEVAGVGSSPAEGGRGGTGERSARPGGPVDGVAEDLEDGIGRVERDAEEQQIVQIPPGGAQHQGAENDVASAPQPGHGDRLGIGSQLVDRLQRRRSRDGDDAEGDRSPT